MKIVVKEEDWEKSEYKTKEWEQSVKIVKWTHDYVDKIYIIEFIEK